MHILYNVAGNYDTKLLAGGGSRYRCLVAAVLIATQLSVIVLVQRSPLCCDVRHSGPLPFRHAVVIAGVVGRRQYLYDL